MQHPGFFQRGAPLRLRAIAGVVGAQLAHARDGSLEIEDVRALDRADARHLTFFSSRKHTRQLADTAAGACLIKGQDIGLMPAKAAALTTTSPQQAFALAVGLFYPTVLKPDASGSTATEGGRLVHPTAEIDKDVLVEPGAIIGREARIGSGTRIAAGAIVGYRVFIGRDCYLGPGSSVTHSVLGDRVLLHAGARLGQDGFGYAMESSGHCKIPQIGSVIVGDDVEVGANSTIDRGFLSDTVIGAGTKIDNLVQIAHNVVIGRHCVIVSQSGIAGSARLGDFVVMGARSGVVEHVEIGDGALIAGMAHVKNDVAPGARMGGTPARPFNEWARELAALKRLSKKR